MIIEMIGPKGIGKTTTAGAIAERLGIRFFRGQGFHHLDGSDMSRSDEWLDRTISVARAPSLFVTAARVQAGAPKQRLRFALNVCRRDRFAQRAGSEDTGVIESGPLNSLLQASASYGHDVITELYPRTFRSDIYVRLRAPASVVANRLESRGGVSEQRVADHADWVERYDRWADNVLAAVDAPVVVVDAGLPPEAVVDDVVRGLRGLEVLNGLDKPR